MFKKQLQVDKVIHAIQIISLHDFYHLDSRLTIYVFFLNLTYVGVLHVLYKKLKAS